MRSECVVKKTERERVAKDEFEDASNPHQYTTIEDHVCIVGRTRAFGSTPFHQLHRDGHEGHLEANDSTFKASQWMSTCSICSELTYSAVGLPRIFCRGCFKGGPANFGCR